MTRLVIMTMLGTCNTTPRRRVGRILSPGGHRGASYRLAQLQEESVKMAMVYEHSIEDC